MADDKRDGDDLFEDLDKFFAPIQDVDWPEPGASEPARPATTHEEHVSVHASEPADAPVAATDEDEEWYDTSTLSAIASDGPDFGHEEPSSEPAEQAGLFIGEIDDETQEEDDDDWSAPVVVRGDDEEEDDDEWPSVEAPEVSVPVDEPAMDEPSEEDIEAAAAHFASSTDVSAPALEPYPTETIAFDAEVEPVSASAGDLLSDLGAGGYDPSGVEDDILSDLDDETVSPRTVRVGAEGFGGPSWQEPTSHEVGADLERRGPNSGERDVPAAFMTGIVLAGVALASLLAGKGAFAVVATVVVLGAQFELFTVMQKHHHQPATLVGLAGGALIIAGAYYKGESAMLAMFALGVIATFLWFMAVPAAHRKNQIQNIGLTILNMAYIPLLAGYLLVTLSLGGDDGKALVVAVIALTFVYDTGAFLVGAVWGGSFLQRPLAPDTSPKKSWEGALGASLITILVSMSLVPSFVGLFENKRIESFMLAVVVAAMATFGDLAESLIKRDVGIKDMGSILPGHGGILDRIDSLLFVAPAAFLLFRVIFF